MSSHKEWIKPRWIDENCMKLATKLLLTILFWGFSYEVHLNSSVDTTICWSLTFEPRRVYTCLMQFQCTTACKWRIHSPSLFFFRIRTFINIQLSNCISYTYADFELASTTKCDRKETAVLQFWFGCNMAQKKAKTT